MQENSLFLGRLRGPVKTAMIATTALTIALYLYLITQAVFSPSRWGCTR